jgi:hypothetical protein
MPAQVECHVVLASIVRLFAVNGSNNVLKVAADP